MISVIAAAALVVVAQSGQSASVRVETAGLSRHAVAAAVRQAATRACTALALTSGAPAAGCVREASFQAMRDYDRRSAAARVTLADLR